MGRRPAWLAYGLSGFLVGMAGVATALLWPWVEPSPTLLFFPAIMVAATYGGLGPGLAATMFSTAAIAYFFMPPYWSFKVYTADLVRLLVFVAATLLIASIAHARRTAEAALVEATRLRAQLYEQLQEFFERESAAAAARQSVSLHACLLEALRHKLRTPLTAIAVAATSMRQHDDANPAQTRHQLIDVIEEEAARLDRFVADLGGQNEDPATANRIRPIAVGDLLHATRASADRLARAHRLIVERGDDLPLVAVDQASVVEALSIVLENAAQYSPPQTTIRIAWARHDSDHVGITITDEGPADDLTKSARSGLGFSIARRLVTGQGGQFWIRAVPPGQGTQVVVMLPIATA